MLKVGQVILLLQVFFLNVHFINSAATISTESLETSKQEQLLKAIHANDLEMVQKLVHAGVNVNAVRPDEMSLLSDAIINGANESIVKFLIENGAEINFVHEEGLTPLNHATEVLAADNVKLLLKAGADLNEITKNQLAMLIDFKKSDLNRGTLSLQQISSFNEIIKLLENEEERRKKMIQKYNEEILKKIGESEYGSKSIPPLVKLSTQYLIADKYEDIPLSYRLGS